jgi:hypothetical protein
MIDKNRVIIMTTYYIEMKVLANTVLKYVLLLLVIFTLSSKSELSAQSSEWTVIDYETIDEIFANPERGFYTYTISTPPNGTRLNANVLRQNRTEGRTLIIRIYNLENFRDTDLPQSFLEQLELDFQALRDAGMKAVLRFYHSRNLSHPDAPLSTVLRQIDQLKPFLENNYDVIAVANGGFIGAWGEWHGSTNNLDTPSNMRTILHAFMDALPDRSIQIRYPQAKMQIYNSAQPIQPENAFDGSYKSRAGHLNDCFLASPTDVGTYRVPPAPYEFEKNYLAQDTKYTPMGGETCNPSSDAGTRFHCATALEELDRMNWSFLNLNYSRIILDHWIAEGCYPEIERRLGYRLALKKGEFNETIQPGGNLKFKMVIDNTGFASPYNKRDVKVVLRSFDNPETMYESFLPVDPRLWFSGGTYEIDFNINVPAEVPEGMYEILLALPDPMPRLKDNPEFSIRFGNKDVWEENTGFNKLNHIVFIDSSAEPDGLEPDVSFSLYGTTTSIGEERSSIPSEIKLHQNYPNPFNPSTTISFDLAQSSNVKLEVFDMLGQRIAKLLDGNKSQGTHSVRFDGVSLSSGMYIYRLSHDEGEMSRSMTLIK